MHHRIIRTYGLALLLAALAGCQGDESVKDEEHAAGLPKTAEQAPYRQSLSQVIETFRFQQWDHSRYTPYATVAGQSQVAHDHAARMKDLKVKSITGYWHRSETDTAGARSKYFEYDENGNLTLTGEYHDQDSILKWRQEYTYNDNGNIATCKRFIRDDFLILELRLAYNSNGQLYKAQQLDMEGALRESKLYDYDEAGTMVKETTVGVVMDTAGTREDTLLVIGYQWDDKAQQVTESTSYKGESVSNERTISYNDTDGSSEVKLITDMDTISFITTMNYNSEGRLMKWHYNDPTMEGERSITWAYDQNGLMQSADGDLKAGPVRYEYDAKGLLSRVIFLKQDGSVQWSYSFKYEFHK